MLALREQGDDLIIDLINLPANTLKRQAMTCFSPKRRSLMEQTATHEAVPPCSVEQRFESDLLHAAQAIHKQFVRQVEPAIRRSGFSKQRRRAVAEAR